jgi:hypothetical protein
MSVFGGLSYSGFTLRVKNRGNIFESNFGHAYE